MIRAVSGRSPRRAAQSCAARTSWQHLGDVVEPAVGRVGPAPLVEVLDVRRDVRRVGGRGRLPSSVVEEPGGVLPHQRQHPEAGLVPVAGRPADQAVVDQHAERVDHVAVRPDRLDGLERHRAVEDRRTVRTGAAPPARAAAGSSRSSPGSSAAGPGGRVPRRPPSRRRPASRCRRSERRQGPQVAAGDLDRERAGRPRTGRSPSTSSTCCASSKRGSTAVATCSKRATASARPSRPALGVSTDSGLHLEHLLAGDAKPRPAGHQHPEVVGPLDHLAHEVRGVDDVLEVVEHQQQGLPAAGPPPASGRRSGSRRHRMPSSRTVSSATRPASRTFVRST